MNPKASWLDRLRDVVVLSVLVGAGGFLWQAHAQLAELRTELRLTADRLERSEVNTRTLEQWIRDYVARQR